MSRIAVSTTAWDDEVRLDTKAHLWSIMRNDHLIAGAWLTAALLYATLRYNVLKHVPWADWPTYIVNKAFGVSSLILLALSAFRWSVGKPAGKPLMLWSGGLAGAHVVLSLILLNPEYYPKFFAGTKFNAVASFSMLFGVLAFALQELGARKSQHWSPTAKRIALALLAVLIGVHAALTGIPGWFVPAMWPGGLPPITLVSATIALSAAFALTFKAKRWKS